MAFNIKKRGKLTYYYTGDQPVLSALVTEEQSDGDLKIYFAGLTGGYSAKGVLDLDELVSMDPDKEIPLVFQCWEKWLVDGTLTEKELFSVKQPEPEEIENSGLEMIYLSYFVPWNSHYNYEVAQRWGFKHLGHEYQREGSVDNYDQIDSIGYLFNPFLKYPKFGHSIATDIASRWIRYGL